MNTRNVTNTAFTSYPATRVELPNGRRLANSYDVLYRRTLVRDVTNGVNVAAWQFFGPSRVAEVNLANGLTCTWMNDARTHSGVQPTVANPAWGDQSSDRLGYDGAGRPITKRYLAGGLNGSNGYANPSAVVGFTTEYDLASNKFYERALHAPARSSLYEPFSDGSPTGGYDSINRLRQYQRGVLTSDDGFAGNGGGSVVSGSSIALPGTDTQRTYDLDSLGNWRRTNFTLVSAPDTTQTVQEVRQHNGLNEITRIQDTNSATGISQASFSYDGQPGASNGNLANDGTRSYAWDALNRLIEVKRVSDGAVIGQYVYDALNRRIRKTIPDLGGNLGGLTGNIPAGTTDCIYSDWRCVEERNPFGESGDTPTIQYVWGIYLDELLQQFNIVALNGFSANVALYPLQDLLYRTTGLADSSGTVREAYDTDAYGNTLIFRNSGSPPSPITWIDSGEGADTPVDYPTCPFIFTGQRFDAETGVYYYKERYYGPELGRFLSRDPLSPIGTSIRRGQLRLAGGEQTSEYAYTKTNPPNRVDSLGLEDSDSTDPCKNVTKTKTCRGLLKVPKPSKEKRGHALGLAFCKDGEVTYELYTSSPSDEDEAGKLMRSDPCVMDCVKIHEEYHVKELKAWCPDFCKCAGKGEWTWDYARGSHTKEIWECPAYAAALQCLNNYFQAKPPRAGGKQCSLGSIRAAIDLFKGIARELNCANVDKPPPDPPVYPDDKAKPQPR